MKTSTIRQESGKFQSSFSSEIFYRDSGDETGSAVILIHGFPFTQAMWETQVPELAAEYRIITYDLRGFGESKGGDLHYTMETFVDDLLNLMDHLAIHKAVLVGFSMGGYIALRALERHPDRWSGLVLADTQTSADSDETKLKRSDALRIVKTYGVSAFGNTFLKQALAPQTFSTNKEAVRYLQSIISLNDIIGISAGILALLSRTDTTRSLTAIEIPTLVIVGEEDKITPVSVAAEMQRLIPGALLKVIPRAGHMSNVENPTEFNHSILTFLRGIEIGPLDSL